MVLLDTGTYKDKFQPAKDFNRQRILCSPNLDQHLNLLNYFSLETIPVENAKRDTYICRIMARDENIFLKKTLEINYDTHYELSWLFLHTKLSSK